MTDLIFDLSRSGRFAKAQLPANMKDTCEDIPADLLRQDVPRLPEVSELQVVRHYTNFRKKIFPLIRIFIRLVRAP